MCLIALAWQRHPDWPLIVAANRDEYHARPTAPAGYWTDAPHIFGGRDLQDGGTWLAVTRDARFAALTNYRDPARPARTSRSRGHLVSDYLRTEAALPTHVRLLASTRAQYNGFNLLFGDRHALWYMPDSGSDPAPVSAGVHALSNARLDTPWPKATGLAETLRKLVDRPGLAPATLVESMFDALADTRPAPDELLPATGVGAEKERLLSSRMIVAPVYGTRSSSVMLVPRSGAIRFAERSYDPEGRVIGTVIEQIAPSGSRPG